MLLRHAHAGDKHRWTGPDALRPLSRRGLSQARSVVEPLALLQVHRIVSSPSLRCMETVLPLADKVGLDVVTEKLLLPGGDLTTLTELLASREFQDAVVCTHREVLVPLLTKWRKVGTVRVPADVHTPKGAFRVVRHYPGPDAQISEPLSRVSSSDGVMDTALRLSELPRLPGDPTSEASTA